MRAVVQRVLEASVKADGEPAGKIGRGLLVFLGVASGDTEKDADHLAEKVAKLRVLDDGNGKMNLSALDLGQEIMVISQFTLYGDCSKGHRPDFTGAEKPQAAEKLYDYFIGKIKALGLKTASGRFGADMEIAALNDGPVTVIIDSRR